MEETKEPKIILLGLIIIVLFSVAPFFFRKPKLIHATQLAWVRPYHVVIATIQLW